MTIHGSYCLTVKCFFSYSFNEDDEDGIQVTNVNSSKMNYNNSNNRKIVYIDVDNYKKFIQYVNERLIKRLLLDMILNSKTTRNEDRFNAILLIWNKYKHKINNKNTISE